MKKDLNKLIEMLNGDIYIEYSSAIEYLKYASRMTGFDYQTIINEFKKTSKKQIPQTEMIKEQMNYIEGKPVKNKEQIYIFYSNDDNLNQIFEKEKKIIGKYKIIMQHSEKLKELALDLLLNISFKGIKEENFDLVKT